MNKPDCVSGDLSPDTYTKEMLDRIQLANANYGKYLQERLQRLEAEHATELAAYLPTLVMLQLAKLACDPKADISPPDIEALADDLTDIFVAIALNKFQTVLTGTFKE